MARSADPRKSAAWQRRLRQSFDGLPGIIRGNFGDEPEVVDTAEGIADAALETVEVF